MRTLLLIAVALALSACASARLAVEDSLGYGWQALRGICMSSLRRDLCRIG